MALDKDKILADIKALAKPELEAQADKIRTMFMKNVDEFIDSTKAHVLDDLVKKAAGYEVEAIMASDREEADQYAEAARDVLLQIQTVLIAEQVVAQKQMAAMIEAAALSIWEGFKEVATSALGIVVKGALTGLLGPAGGAIADVAGSFLGDDGDDAA